MEKQKWAYIILALIYVALGVVFIVRPIGVGSALCYVLAAAVAVIGLLYLVGYMIQRPDAAGQRVGNGFAFGILLIMMAIFIVVKQELVISLVPFLFGVMVMIRGLLGVQNMLFMRRRMGSIGLGMLLASLVTMGMGLFIMLFPFKTAQMLFVLIGIGLLLGGLAGIAEEVVTRIAVRNEAHEAERARDMEGVRDVEPEPIPEAAEAEAPAKAERTSAKAEKPAAKAEEASAEVEEAAAEAEAPAKAEDGAAKAEEAVTKAIEKAKKAEEAAAETGEAEKE